MQASFQAEFTIQERSDTQTHPMVQPSGMQWSGLSKDYWQLKFKIMCSKQRLSNVPTSSKSLDTKQK